MPRVMSTEQFKNETYNCNNCDKDLSKDEVTKNWKCTHCSERVKISADTLDQDIMRKLPSEVTSRDYVYHGGEFYQVFKSEKKKDGYQYNLKGFGAYKQSSYDWVNVMAIFY